MNRVPVPALSRPLVAVLASTITFIAVKLAPATLSWWWVAAPVAAWGVGRIALTVLASIVLADPETLTSGRN